MPEKRLKMVINTVVTDDQGNVTVKDVLELNQMTLADVLIMEKKMNTVLNERIDEQLGDLADS